jgi:hypothetical protein
VRVINIRSAPKGWKENPQYVYIGRSGRGMDGYFGNPFPLREGETRGATLERYRFWLEQKMEADNEYRERVMELRGKTLVCFCAPQPCHGDILSSIANSEDAS